VVLAHLRGMSENPSQTPGVTTAIQAAALKIGYMISEGGYPAECEEIAKLILEGMHPFFDPHHQAPPTSQPAGKRAYELFRAAVPYETPRFESISAADQKAWAAVAMSDDTAPALALEMVEIIKFRDGLKNALLEAAWGLIANAGGGNWQTQCVEWRQAAAHWRDWYHAKLNTEPDMPPMPALARSE